jgi:hypothetical protein
MISEEEFTDYIEHITDIKEINELIDYSFESKKINIEEVKKYIQNYETFDILKTQKYKILLKEKYPEYTYIDFTGEYTHELKLMHNNNEITISYNPTYWENLCIYCNDKLIFQNKIDKLTRKIFDLDYVKLFNVSDSYNIELLNIFKYMLKIKKNVDP